MKRQRYLVTAFILAAGTAISSALPAFAGEWQKKEDVWYYLDGSGNPVKNTWVDGFYLGADGAWVPEKDKNYYNHNVHEHYESVSARIYRGTVDDYQDCWQMRGKLYAWYNGNGPVETAPKYETTLRISKDAAIPGFACAADFLYTVDNTDSGYWYLTKITQDENGYIVEAAAAKSAARE